MPVYVTKADVDAVVALASRDDGDDDSKQQSDEQEVEDVGAGKSVAGPDGSFDSPADRDTARNILVGTLYDSREQSNKE